ncbi:hypothetical protein ABT294_25375 [Nonomuraea sp. NPDC000554]
MLDQLVDMHRGVRQIRPIDQASHNKINAVWGSGQGALLVL